MLVSVATCGDGWHNYHHTFPWDYKNAELLDYKLNLSTLFIDLFSLIGWAYDLKTVPAELVAKRALRTGDGTRRQPAAADAPAPAPAAADTYHHYGRVLLFNHMLGHRGDLAPGSWIASGRRPQVVVQVQHVGQQTPGRFGPKLQVGQVVDGRCR